MRSVAANGSKKENSLLHHLNIFHQCAELREMGLSVWSCPQLVFLLMGAIIIASIILTYSIAERYADAQIVALIVIVLTVFLLTIAYIIVNAFERVVHMGRRETERAKEVIALKDQFVFVAAHELRTPANAIKWGVRLLETSASAAVKEEQKIFDIIKQSNERLILLVEDILVAARIEGQVVQIAPTPTNVARAAAEAVNELGSEIQARGVSVETTIPSDLPHVFADAIRLKEVFINLLSNAVKYSDLRSGHVRIAARREENEVLIGVTNDGPGIKPEDQPHVFEKFWRARETSSTQQGTGLGLFIVKELVSRMAGRVFFTSRPGETVFSIAFRVAP